MKTTDEILSTIQHELKLVNQLTYHDHNKQVGNRTIYDLLFNAEHAVTELRTMLNEQCRNEVNKILNEV